jgi:hypothetical protein
VRPVPLAFVRRRVDVSVWLRVLVAIGLVRGRRDPVRRARRRLVRADPVADPCQPRERTEAEGSARRSSASPAAPWTSRVRARRVA